MKIPFLIFALLLNVFWSCSPKYSHYANHKKEVHHKSLGTSHKGPATTTTNAASKATTPVRKGIVPAKANSVVVGGQKMIGSSYKTRMISKDTLARLKAVLISANVDGPDGEGTKRYKSGMQETSAYLKASGIQVSEFFCPDDDWEKIKAASAGAHIIMYSGHGVYDGTIPPKWVGGFGLTKDFVSSHEIQEELKPAKNAIMVFNHSCFTAGSAAGDPMITQAEAHRRVSIYSHPFMDLGFAGYYANNYYGITNFFDGLFAGNCINDIYISTATSTSQILEIKPYEFRTDSSIGISKDGENGYDVAFVGRKGFTIMEWLTPSKEK